MCLEGVYQGWLCNALLWYKPHEDNRVLHVNPTMLGLPEEKHILTGGVAFSWGITKGPGFAPRAVADQFESLHTADSDSDGVQSRLTCSVLSLRE